MPVHRADFVFFAGKDDGVGFLQPVNDVGGVLAIRWADSSLLATLPYFEIWSESGELEAKAHGSRPIGSEFLPTGL